MQTRQTVAVNKKLPFNESSALFPVFTNVEILFQRRPNAVTMHWNLIFLIFLFSYQILKTWMDKVLHLNV